MKCRAEGVLRRPNRTLTFTKNTVTKVADPELLRTEVEKSLRAREIGRSSGVFCVPKIIDYDEQKGIVIFERIKNIKPINEVLFSRTHDYSLMKNIGRTLAVIHDGLSLPEEMKRQLPKEYNLPGSKAFIHGDFDGRNVCLKTDSESYLVVLDWQTSDLVGSEATWGNRYFDIFFFIHYAFFSVPRVDYIWSGYFSRLALDLIESYFNMCQSGCDRLGMYRYANHVLARSKFVTTGGGRKARLMRKLLAARLDRMRSDFVHALRP